jgi:hypothetical protein
VSGDACPLEAVTVATAGAARADSRPPRPSPPVSVDRLEHGTAHLSETVVDAAVGEALRLVPSDVLGERTQRGLAVAD